MKWLPDEIWRKIFAADFDVAPIVTALAKLLQPPVPSIGTIEHEDDVYSSHEEYTTNTAMLRSLDLKKKTRQALKEIRQAARA